MIVASRGRVLAAALLATSCTKLGSYQLEQARGAPSEIGARCAADCRRNSRPGGYPACLDRCPGVVFHAGVTCLDRVAGCIDECHSTTASAADFEACTTACRARPPDPALLCETARRVDPALALRTGVAVVLGAAFWVGAALAFGMYAYGRSDS
jgi:hypothetical protein